MLYSNLDCKVKSVVFQTVFNYISKNYKTFLNSLQEKLLVKDVLSESFLNFRIYLKYIGAIELKKKKTIWNIKNCNFFRGFCNRSTYTEQNVKE